MRRFLNLNQPGIIFVKVIGFFIGLIPAILYGIALLGSETGISRALLFSMIKVSFFAGGFIFIVFLGLIVIEQIQDHFFDAQYQKQRNHKVFLANGYYECQYCGNRRVREKDQVCSVCGKEFKLTTGK